MIRPLIKLRRFGAAALLALAGVSESLGAQAIPASPAPVRFSLHNNPDLIVFGGAAILGIIPTLAGRSLPYGHCAPCDSTRLPAIDRNSIGLPRDGLSMASTATMGATIVGAGMLVALSRHGEPQAARAGREDIAVLVQAVELDYLVNTWLKVLTHRARPVLYTSLAGQNQTVDAGRAFPSGHASFAFAGAAAAASILQRRHELGSHKLPVVLLFTGAAATAALRVAAHKHFPTDAVAGAVMGTVIGWAVPRLHSIR